MRIEEETKIAYEHLYYTNVDTFTREAKFEVMLAQYTMISEIMTREIAVSLIKEGLTLGWTKSIEHLSVYRINAVVLTKGNKRALIGRLDNGDWLVRC